MRRTGRWARAAGVMCGAAVVAATLVAPAAATTKAHAPAAGPAAPAPVPAPRKALLSTGETAELDRGKLRVSGRDGAPSGPYAFAGIRGATEVTPTGRRTPQATTRLGTADAGTAASGPAARAATTTTATTANQRVKIDLINTYHWGGLIHVWNRTTWQWYDVQEEQWDDFGTVYLPAGEYVVVGLWSNWQQPTHLLAKTFTVGSAPLTVTLDANASKPTRIAVDDPSAVRAASSVWMSMPNGDIAGFAGGRDAVYVTPIALPGVSLKVHEVLGRKGSTPNRPSPYRYDVVHTFPNGVPTTPVASVRTADLAKTRTTVRASGAGISAWYGVAAMLGDDSGVYSPSAVPAPGTFTHYLTPGRTYHRFVQQGDFDDQLPALSPPSGESPAETFGPAPLTVAGGSRWNRGTFLLDETSLVGSDGAAGKDYNATHTYRVTAEGQELGRSGPLPFSERYSLPVNSYATYGIHHVVSRAHHSTRLSPRIETDWLVSGSTLSSYGSSALPVIDARLDVPGLDLRNRAAAGPVAVRVSLANRVPAYAATLTSVEYSFDDGGTWQTAPLAAEGATGTATVDVPATAGFVSLRISGTDASGGSVTQTVTRAFGGPGTQTALKAGSISVSGAVVNDAKPITPTLTGEETYTARFTVDAPGGLGAAGLHFFHGPYTNPDGLLSVFPGRCTKRATGTVHDCVAEFHMNAATYIGLNKLAGTWSIAAWAHSADGASVYQGPVAGQVSFKRASTFALNSVAPQPVSRGGTLTVTGRLTGAPWEYGAATALAGQQVQLRFKMYGANTTWSVVATGVTDANGAVTIKRTAWNDGHWRLVYPGSAAAPWAGSAWDWVDVR
ncbi:hypothetical protein [Streptomyces sp. NPDC127092]|uniref:hypothetical protein n=1 Tax=Streptomyces sp. NPDC127092 TaxID=3347135 RepID=UPI003653B261